jgi:outer membrane protein
MQGRFNRVIRTTFAALLAAGLGTAATADTLRDAMADAYRNSQLLEQNRYLLRVQDENVTQAVAQLFPVINFVASSARNLTNSTTTATASLVGEIVIYQGGQRLNAIEAAEATVEATRQQLVALEQQVLLDAVTAYLGVWRDMQVVAVGESNVRVITQQLRAARDRFEVGEDTRTDVAQAEAQLALARSNLAASRGSLEISRELFNLAIGRYPNGLSGPGQMPTLPTSESAAEALARQNHPAILALQSEVAAAEFAAEQARGTWRPTISAQTSVTETFQNPNPLAEGRSSTIGLELRMPIYQGGRLASLERQALAQVAAVRSSLNQQTLVNLQAVGNAYARLRIANAQIQASDQRIRAAQLAFEGVREEASLGARTTLDVLDAEQDLLDARISRIQAQTDLYIAAYGVLAASGLLTVEQLHLPVPEYDAEAYSAAFGDGVPRVLSTRGAQLDSVLERIGRD